MVGDATHVVPRRRRHLYVVLCRADSFDLHPSSTLLAVARRHGGGEIWLLAPGPPHDQVARSGGGRVLERLLPPPSHPRTRHR